MATFNNLGVTAYPKNPAFTVGALQRVVKSQFSVVASGSAIGDLYILGGPFTFDMRIARIFAKRGLPALTSAAANLGFYYKKADGTYAVVASGSNTTLWSAVSLATAVTTAIDALTSKNTSLDTSKNIGQLLGLGPDQEPFGGVYLGMALTAATAADGTLDLDIEVQEATTR